MTYRKLIAALTDRRWINLDDEAHIVIYHRNKEGSVIQYESAPLKMIITYNDSKTVLTVENDEIREYFRN